MFTLSMISMYLYLTNLCSEHSTSFAFWYWNGIFGYKSEVAESLAPSVARPSGVIEKSMRYKWNIIFLWKHFSYLYHRVDASRWYLVQMSFHLALCKMNSSHQILSAFDPPNHRLRSFRAHMTRYHMARLGGRWRSICRKFLIIFLQNSFIYSAFTQARLPMICVLFAQIVLKCCRDQGRNIAVPCATFQNNAAIKICCYGRTDFGDIWVSYQFRSILQRPQYFSIF